MYLSDEDKDRLYREWARTVHHISFLLCGYASTASSFYLVLTMLAPPSKHIVTHRGARYIVAESDPTELEFKFRIFYDTERYALSDIESMIRQYFDAEDMHCQVRENHGVEFRISFDRIIPNAERSNCTASTFALYSADSFL